MHRATDPLFEQYTTKPHRLKRDALGSQQLRVSVDTLNGNITRISRRPAPCHKIL